MLAQPEFTDHQCVDDQFIVSGGGFPIPVICGTNSGGHMYVDMGLAKSHPITLTAVSGVPGIKKSVPGRLRVSQTRVRVGYGYYPTF